jgi:dihydrofolate synthase/folylpolyglutamate synthase
VRLGLGRTRALLRELGQPQVGLHGALVAGTNGKGSVLALAGSAVRAAGYRTGLTPKPHLVTYRERVVVDGSPIPAPDFARLVGRALDAADRVERRAGPPTEFELLTAVVFAWFAEAAVEVALVEVGLGGRLDATHAWDGGVAVVTNVDLDHTDRLGTTVPEIAAEKAAIIERGDVAVTGATGDALAVVSRRAQRVGAPLIAVPPAPVLEVTRDGIVADVGRLGPTSIGLRGRHQGANVAVADALLDALETAGTATVPDAARRAGYAAARWPGRLELIESRGREILLDGAHNPAGAATLATAIDDLRPFLAGGARAGSARMTLVTATMADKDVDGIIGALATTRWIRDGRVICTEVPGARAMPAGELAARWSRHLPAGEALAEPEPLAALEEALSEGGGPVVVAGSLYLVGTIRQHLVDDPLLRDPAEGPGP